MAQTVEFILERAIATRNAQNEIAATWLWLGKTVARWDADIAAVQAAQETEAEKGNDELARRGELDAGLADLHMRTQQGVSVAKSIWKGDASKFARVQNLTAGAQSRAGILDEALNWETAWQAADDTFVPVAGNTLVAFNTLRADCLAKEKAYQLAHSDDRTAATQLRHLADLLDDANVAWYAAATAVFPEGTPEGGMIRGTVPTSYSPSPPPTPQPPAPPPPPNP